MARNRRGTWGCPSCGRKTPNKYPKCEHCDQSRKGCRDSTYLGRNALAKMGIKTPRGMVVPVGMIKVRRPRKKQEVSK